jgi:uncharacterized protein (DUF608 family)
MKRLTQLAAYLLLVLCVPVARAVDQKRWNGEYFSYDTLSEYRDNVQADQLAGKWYANMTALATWCRARCGSKL